MGFWLAGEKIWLFIKFIKFIKTNIMGIGVDKREKGKMFTLLGGKNMILEKGGGEYSIFGKYIPLTSNRNIFRRIPTADNLRRNSV